MFETAKDAAAKSGALSALNGLGDRTKGQFAVDEEGREQVRNFMLKHLEDESADVRKCALQGMLFVVRQRADAKTAADLEGNLQIKQALEKHLETETDELLKTWTEGLLSLYRKEPRPGMGTIPLPPETTP